MRYQRISADCHIDLPWIPPDLFTANASAALKDRVPYVKDGPDGPFWTAKNGTSFGLWGGVGPAGSKYEPGKHQRVDVMAATGLYEDGRKGIARPTTPALRAKDMDRDGVQAEVIYGILGAASRLDDPEVTDCVTHIYNGWLAEFCRKAPGRFAGIGCLSSAQPERAAQELARCASLGLAGAELGMSHDMLPLWHPSWEPIWRASDETGLPVHIHTIGPRADTRFMDDPAHYRPWLATHISAFQMPMMALCAAVIFGGALERHRRMKVVIGEAGIGWLPYALERFDYEWEDQFRDLIPRPPSEYWRRQMFATFQIDRTGLENLERIGAETVMWGSDFPHPDGTWPDSREILRPQLAAISPADQRKILFENAARLYRFPIRG